MRNTYKIGDKLIDLDKLVAIGTLDRFGCYPATLPLYFCNGNSSESFLFSKSGKSIYNPPEPLKVLVDVNFYYRDIAVELGMSEREVLEGYEPFGEETDFSDSIFYKTVSKKIDELKEVWKRLEPIVN